MSKSWAERVRHSWLGDEKICERLDAAINTRLRATGGPPRLALSIPKVRDDIMALGDAQAWLWCTTAIALTGELLVCALDGGALSAKLVERAAQNREAWVVLESLHLLRNAVCHPAHYSTSAGAGEPQIVKLARHMAQCERDMWNLAHALADDWARLGSREMSLFALRRLNALGHHVAPRYELGKLFERRRGADFPRRHVS